MTVTTENEPAITINGVELTTAQAMTVRVAITAMQMELHDPEYMRQLGPIGALYQDRLREVMALVLAGS